MAAFSTQRGLFGAPMMDRSAEGAGPVQRDAVVPTYKKPSTANLIIGTIGDTLSQIGGGRGTYLPGLQQRQAQAYETQQLQQRRADDYTDWQRKEQYKAEHAGPAQDDAFTTTLRNAGIDPQSAEGKALYRQRAQTQANPAPTFVSDGAGGGRWVQPSFGANAAPPSAPVGKLTPVGGASLGARSFPLR